MSQYIGRKGENKTRYHLWWALRGKHYRNLHNLILPSRNGTAQIDHLVVSTKGIFIIETKNMSGWIYGSEDGARWTQVLFQQRHSFQNPLRQTFRQKKVLAEFLNIHEAKIYTIVYFVGNCAFRTKMPRNAMRSGLARYIKGHQPSQLTQQEFETITKTLKKHKKDSRLSNKDHLESLRQRHSSTSICPRCGSKLIVKTAKEGLNPGSKFYGCESYPRCRFSKGL